MEPGAGEAFDSAVKGEDAHPQDFVFPPSVLKNLSQFIWAGAAGGLWSSQNSPGLSHREMGHGQKWSNPTSPGLTQHQDGLGVTRSSTSLGV